MRELLKIVGIMLGISILGWFGYVLIFGGSGAADLVVREIDGMVEYIDPAGAVGLALPGQSVEARARLRSGEDGRAILEFGADSTITLAESTSIRVIGVERDAVRVELDEGRVEATVRPGRMLSVVNGEREIRSREGALWLLRLDPSRWWSDGGGLLLDTRGLAQHGTLRR